MMAKSEDTQDGIAAQQHELESVPKEESRTEASASQPFQPRLAKPHPLIAKAREKPPKPDRWGYVDHDPRPSLDMRVSKEQERNAFIVLDRLFKALEAEQMKIQVFANYQASGTYAVVGEDKAGIQIEEEYRKVPHTPTKKELEEKERYPDTRIPKHDSVPTGCLKLHPGGVVDLSSEEALNQLIGKAVDEIKSTIAKERERREAREARRREEAKRERKAREEEKRIEKLQAAAEAFDRYRKLMAYIEEVRRFGRPPEDQRIEGESLVEWLNWAEWQARRIHPLG